MGVALATASASFGDEDGGAERFIALYGCCRWLLVGGIYGVEMRAMTFDVGLNWSGGFLVRVTVVMDGVMDN